ncbi:hypothetical protein AMS68_002714 [Peltaster fructicola]|uniref:Uncharacterized protein n=1 Tax=Peltaster fructicola TaxID=286661 RepID=A0A6H0XR11_9PEZI|nr:hypothetical protein AMS68_002714 [Peltaster fructicola]
MQTETAYPQASLTARVLRSYSQQSKPRNVFALQYLEARHSESAMPEKVLADLTRMVRQINALSRGLFYGTWTDVSGHTAVIKALLYGVLGVCRERSFRALSRAERIMNTARGLPELNIESAPGLLERLTQWEGSIRPVLLGVLNGRSTDHLQGTSDDS